MGMLGWLGGREAGEDMARAKAGPIQAARVDEIVGQLKSTVGNADAFSRVYGALAEDASLTTQDVIAVAHKFVGGAKPKTKKVALIAIGQEWMRVSHAKSKTESAAKTKLW